MTETGWKEKIGRGVSRWGKWILVLVIAAGAVYWLQIRTVSVAGYTAVQGEIVAEVMGTGTLEAKVQTIVSTKIPGRILDMHVDQGDHVRAGQTLLRLDDSEFRQQVKWLDKGLVAVTPGSAFNTPGWQRISYATSMERLHDAVLRIRSLS